MISPGDNIRHDLGTPAADDPTDRPAGFAGTAQMDKPKTEEVKDRASRVTQETKDALGRASQDFTEQARAAGEELRGAASRVTGEAKTRLSEQVGQRKEMVVGQVASLGAAFRDAADRLEGECSPVAGYARAAADGIDNAADYLRNADYRDLYNEAERFTRRHPEVVLGGLFLVGVGIARFLKSSADERRQDEAERRLRSGGSYGTEMRPIGQFGVGGYGDLNAPAPLAYPGDLSSVGPAAASIGPDDYARADEQLTDVDVSGFGNTSELGAVNSDPTTGCSLGATGSANLGSSNLVGGDEAVDLDIPPYDRTPR